MNYTSNIDVGFALAQERLNALIERRVKAARAKIRLIYAAAMMELGMEPDGQYRLFYEQEKK